MLAMTNKAVLVVGLALAVALCGCSSNKKKEEAAKDKQPDAFQREFFETGASQRAVDRFVEVQAAEGAKEDAMLFASHFDGNELNTAGQAKLNLMLRNQSPQQPMTVYLSLGPNDAMAGARRSAVEKYVKDSGIAVASLDVKEGDNPDTRTTASSNLRNLRKTDSDYHSGGEAGTTGGTQGVESGTSMNQTAPATH
jgi:hypothetical protein